MMEPDDKIDLAPLDPSRDRLRWERLIVGLAKRVTAIRRAPTIGELVSAWARPALAIAAALALVAWVGGAVWPRTAQASEDTSATTALAEWAAADQTPGAADVLDILGRGHGGR